jgi:hypothetical protein
MMNTVTLIQMPVVTQSHLTEQFWIPNIESSHPDPPDRTGLDYQH